MKKRYILFLIAGIQSVLYAQDTKQLVLQKIMQGDRWTGISPSHLQWDITGKFIYFNWNPAMKKQDDLFRVQAGMTKPEQAPDSLRNSLQNVPPVYSADHTNILMERRGDIVLANASTGKERFLTHTTEPESKPSFSSDGQSVIFRKGDNLFCLGITSGELTQLTNFVDIHQNRDTLTQQDQWLREKQMSTFDILKSRRISGGRMENSPNPQPKMFNLDGAAINTLEASPNKDFVFFTLEEPAVGRNIIVPNYVTPSGYTENISGRTKVGAPDPLYKSYLYDRLRDSIYPVNTNNIPGIKDIPSYLKDYPERYSAILSANKEREVTISGCWWNEAGTAAVVNIFSQDHKDRWLMKLNMPDGSLSLLDRQHDDAWIAGPGIVRPLSVGWINDRIFYYQSEASGYTHLYTVDIATNAKKQLTSGKYEVQSLQLSKDRHYFYFTANIKNPGIYHFYRIPVNGGTDPEQLTTMDGSNEVTLSPDEKWLAIRYSYINKPWELYLQKNEPKATPIQITRSTTPEFDAYSWKIPETIVFKNQAGADVYAQVFRPAIPDANRPGVVFVHSNGYLQNVHYGWSYHYREYMFNNLLVDQGYTVINIDYTGSSGYGRDFRTGIYRNMGGQDLADLVEGAKILVEKYQVDPQRIGLYGGSYGGFLTLMAMFKEGDHFKAGAALRSVADWSNYNGRYTSNILNNPSDDPIAYKRSSPLYFVNGLKGNLLMTHGIVDVNVNFQDIVLVSQRLIELGKDNWELAVYPLEDHDFADAVSWTDQYKRIFKLFNTSLKEK